VLRAIELKMNQQALRLLKTVNRGQFEMAATDPFRIISLQARVEGYLCRKNSET